MFNLNNIYTMRAVTVLLEELYFIAFFKGHKVKYNKYKMVTKGSCDHLLQSLDCTVILREKV